MLKIITVEDDFYQGVYLTSRMLEEANDLLVIKVIG